MSSTTATSNAFSSTGRRGHRRDFHFDEHAGLRGAFLRARGRRFVGHDCDGASGQADFGGDGAEAAAVRAADLHEALAHLRPDHADDEQVGLSRFTKWVQLRLQLSAAISLPPVAASADS